MPTGLTSVLLFYRGPDVWCGPGAPGARSLRPCPQVMPLFEFLGESTSPVGIASSQKSLP